MKRSLTQFHLLLLAIALLASVTLISKLPPVRIDLTQDKLYTLSAGTLRLLDKLQGEPIHLTFYFSDKLTESIPTLRAYERRVKETLREYELRSHGKIILDIVDPEPFSEQEDRASSLGLRAVPAGDNDSIYFGLVGEKAVPASVASSGKNTGANMTRREVIAFFNAEKENSLEYDISQLVYRLNQPKPLVVGIISDLPIFQHRDMSSPQTVKPKIILEQLRQMFDIKRVYDSNIDKIDDEVDLLMVVHPHLWPEQTLYAIDQFVLRGGHLLAFMDPDAEMDESEKGLFGDDAFGDKSSSLEQLLTAWGVQYDPKKIVLDYHFAHSIPVTRYGQAMPHVGVLGIRDEGFNRAEAMTATVDQVNISTAGALAAIPGAATHFATLMQSSAESELMDAGEYRKIPNHELLLQKFKPDGKGPYTLAAYVTGSAKTAFPAGKPQVKSQDADDKNGSARPPEATPATVNEKATGSAEIPQPQLLQSQQDISVVLFADTDILDDRMWVQVQDFYGQPVATPWASNSDLIVNVLEKLGGSTDLINVRSRGSYNRPFERVNALEKKANEQLRTEEETLQSRLEETEAKLQELTHPDSGKASASSTEELTPEQKRDVEQFQRERTHIRKTLREVQHSLNRDIEQLGSRLKLINILAVPLLLTLLVLLISLLQRRRLRAARNSRVN
jgi:ABC-type uncharacterized transport system involved in gliding motility auxiliary subunit